LLVGGCNSNKHCWHVWLGYAHSQSLLAASIGVPSAVARSACWCSMRVATCYPTLPPSVVAALLKVVASIGSPRRL